ncbi:uncharacterized protein LOC132304536 isoform X1 [Cornus florida]|uniref:uncharacterized protein LOC132304536 isoform X1 n=1 Tax=Cornus florida TaxID=4283 RepID=UPI002896F278|nr:uncharacterized protein LOC132304536 isoform X1 [Cornus florida]
MKRAPVNSIPQSHRAVDVEDRAKLKYQTLLQEYLELQKEFVSKKRKFQATKQKKDTLLGEIRFLRRRRKYLLRIRSSKLGVEKNVQPQESDMERKMLERVRNYSVNEAALGNPHPILVSNPNSRGPPSRRTRTVTEPVTEPLRVEKKHKNSLIDDKRRLDKKEMSWQDQMSLRV